LDGWWTWLQQWVVKKKRLHDEAPTTASVHDCEVNNTHKVRKRKQKKKGYRKHAPKKEKKLLDSSTP